MNDRLRKLQTFPMVVLEQTKSSLRERGIDVFDFGTGDPIEPTPGSIRQSLLEGLQDVCRYPSIGGLPELRQAAAGYMQRRFGVDLDADSEVLPSMGSKEAIFHLPMTFVQVPSEKDLVVYPEPAYPVFEQGALFAEAWTFGMQLGPDNGYLMDPDALPESVLRRAALVFLNYPHNPTGACLPDSLFESWIAAREQYGFLLVSDECYVDLDYEEPRPRCVLEFGRKGCLAVHSLSKRSGMTGYRSGFLAGDKETLATYKRFRAAMGVAPQEFVQQAGVTAWTDPGHVEDRRQLFAAKRKVLKEHFESIGLRVFPGTAGLFLWVEVPESTTDVDYARLCAEAGIVISPGSYFGRGQERFVRVALVPTLEQCEAAIRVWPR